MDLSIPEYFKNKEIFITGASGFIGKVLVEKILRSCHNFKVIYLLLREKKGHSVQERLKELLENELFDIVREKNPEVFKKVQALSGDVSSLKLGLSSEDRARVRGVHVVFHVAASVRFDDPLRKATLMNTRGTREVMELMLEMPCLEVGVHVSTTYCNTDKEVIHERVYRDHGDWREAVRVAENFEDDYKVACLTEKCLGGLKNTYVMTKHLAENVVEDYSDRLPLVLFRPGVVVSTLKDPIPGWNDNFNGPIALYLGIGKGILRTIYSRKESYMDYMPVDMVIKAMIISSWLKAVKPVPGERLPVYNCSVRGKADYNQMDMTNTGFKAFRARPLNDTVMHPVADIVNNELEFRIKFILFNFMPAFVLDLLLKFAGRKPMVLKVVRKIYMALMAVAYFSIESWDFKADRMWDLNNKLHPSDKTEFEYNFDNFDLDDYVMKALIGVNKYVLKEPEDLPNAIKNYRRNEFVYNLLSYVIYGLLLYFLATNYYVNMAFTGFTTLVRSIGSLVIGT